MTAMLEVNDLHVFYGAIHALQGISFHLDEGEIVTLIGANGAGKSTTLKTISGLLRPRQGSIVFKGTDHDHVSAQKIVLAGHLAGARRAQDLRAAHGAGEPGDGRLHAQRSDGDRASPWSGCSPASRA